MARKKNRAAMDGQHSPVSFVTPMAAQSVKALPSGKEWLYELKIDGFRALLLKEGGRTEVRSRRDNELTQTYPGVAAEIARINADQVVLDGEIVAVDDSGRPSLQALQHRGSHLGYPILYYAFDVLHLNGFDLLNVPLIERRGLLPQLLEGTQLRQCPELPGTVDEIVAAVRGMGLEGIVAKRRDSLYQPGERPPDWQKLQLQRQQELVIGGYRADGQNVDALIVGYYDEIGLRFAGKVRAGLVAHLRRDIAKQLRPFHAERCPFVDLPCVKASRLAGGVSAEEMHLIQWLRPELVAQIAFVEWTADKRLRSSSFLGMRTDVIASEVRREE